MSLQRKSKWMKRSKPLKEKEAKEKRIEFWNSLTFPKLNKPKKKNHEPPMSVRDRVGKRDHGRCQFPGCECSASSLHHIIFRSQGGRNDEENLVSLCPYHHTISKDSPHQSDMWRRYWEEWSQKRYPEYWRKRA